MFLHICWTSVLSIPFFLFFGLSSCPSFCPPARKNKHHFPSPEAEKSALIYNFLPVHRGSDTIFLQNYYFDWWTALKTETGSVRSVRRWSRLKFEVDGQCRQLAEETRRFTRRNLSKSYIHKNLKIKKKYIIKWKYEQTKFIFEKVKCFWFSLQWSLNK